MKSARAKSAVASSPRAWPICPRNLRKDAQSLSPRHLLSRGLPCAAPHREVQYRDAPAVCITVHGRLQVDCIAAV
jgi:hypothetical protein